MKNSRTKNAEDGLRACLEILISAEGGKASLVEALLNEKTAVEDIMTQAIEARKQQKIHTKSVSGRAENLRGSSVTQIFILYQRKSSGACSYWRQQCAIAYRL